MLFHNAIYENAMRKLIVDGNHLTARSRAVLKEMVTSKGNKSGVVFGFLKGLLYVRSKLAIDFNEITVCWDYGRSEVRKRLFPDYKGNREKKEPTPEEQWDQIEYYKQLDALHEVCELIGVTQLRIKGVEADDLIGIYSRFYESLGHQVIIYSGDHDCHQLVSPRIDIFDPKKELQTCPVILSRWGVLNAEDIALVKAIMGDSSDNIPGVHGIGPVRAADVFIHRGYEILKEQQPIQGDVPKTIWKYVLSAWENRELIKRNLLLMRIPREWCDSFYSVEQAQESLVQMMNAGKRRDRMAFVNFLSLWELNSILEQLNRW